MLAFLLTSLVLGLLTASPSSGTTTDAGDPQDPDTTMQVLPDRCLRGGSTMPARPGACRLTRFKGRRTIVVWGDSHAWQQLPAMVTEARRHRINLVAFVMGSCPPMDLTVRTSERGLCPEQARAALTYVTRKARQEARPPKLILGAFWGLYRDLRRRWLAGETAPDARTAYLTEQANLFAATVRPLFRRLERAGVPVAAIAPQPYVPPQAPSCPAGDQPYGCDLPRPEAILDEGPTLRWLQQQLSVIHTSGVVDTARFLCDVETCRPTLNGAPVYLDDLHLNPSVTRAFAPAYRGIFSS